MEQAVQRQRDAGLQGWPLVELPGQRQQAQQWGSTRQTVEAHLAAASALAAAASLQRQHQSPLPCP